MGKEDELKVLEIIGKVGVDDTLRVVQMFAVEKEKAAVRTRNVTGDKSSVERARAWRKIEDAIWKCRQEVAEIGERY